MSNLDEVSVSIGKIQGTLEGHGNVHTQILVKLESMERNINKKFEEYDEHIDKLNDDMSQRKGARALMVGLSGIAGAGAVKLIESILK
jgi:hypothetical protein